jgi:DNA-binding PucR family transcriptional regulator
MVVSVDVRAVDAVVTEVARALDADLPALTREMTDWFVEVIPEFRHDEAVRKLMVASTSSNLGAIVDLLGHSIPLEQITVPAAAAEYARRFAQHALSLEALLRAYRLGENRFVQWAIVGLDRIGGVPTEVALAAVAEVSKRTNSYIDQVIEGLIEIYETERRRWNSRTGAARTAQIRLVLESDSLSEAAARQLLGIPLAGWHRAAIAWLPAEEPHADGLLQGAVRLLTEAAGQGPPLTMLADERTLWAWVRHAAPDEMDLARLREGVAAAGGGLRLALGAQGSGLAGFRGSLREAIRARTVAEATEDGEPVVSFDDVAVAALLTQQRDEVQRWVARVLGDLAGDAPGCRELRETVRVFLEASGSFTQAAGLMHLHKNTVYYRVRKAEELRGRPLTEGRLDVEVALRALQRHRPTLPVTRPASEPIPAAQAGSLTR